MENKINIKRFLNKVSLILMLSIYFSQGLFAQTTYCIPTYMFDCMDGDEITNVTIVGETETLNNSTQCSPAGYGDYTNLTGPDLLAGETYTISISTASFYLIENEAAAWIDYNNDGVFDQSELIADTDGAGMGTGTVTFNFTVPSNLLPGAYRMRVRMAYDPINFDMDPCVLEDWGEAEDYVIEVVGPGCSVNPEAGSVVADIEICPRVAFGLEVNGANINGNDVLGNWQSTLLGEDNWSDIAGAIDTLFTVNDGAEGSMEYRYVVFCTLTDEADTSDVLQVHIQSVKGDTISYTQYGLNVFEFEVLGIEHVGDYFWDFGDGNTSVEATPTHAYDLEGHYDVSVTLYHDSCDDSLVLTTIVSSEVNDINELKKEALMIYPNPVSDYLNLKMTEQFFVKEVTVFDVQGRKMLFQSINNTISDLNLKVNHLPIGIYQLILETSDGYIKKSFEVIK